MTPSARGGICTIIGHKDQLSVEEERDGRNERTIVSTALNELQRTEGGIPWPALRTFAAALATNRELARELFEAYDRAFAKTDLTDNADLYVPAIFALAAPRLDDEQRREIGAFLVQKLAEAGHEDADVSMEILMAAAGTLGPVIVPAVLDTIAKEPDTRGAWLYLWSLTTLAVRTDDPDLRSRVVQACVDLLERADPGRIDLMDAAQAAWTLALLRCTEYTGLLQRLRERALDTHSEGDYRDALKLMEGRLDFTLPQELWEEPVEQWLTPRWDMAEEWSGEEDEYDEDEYELDEEEAEERPFEAYANLLTRTFVTSPLAAGLPPELLSSAYLIVHDLVHFSLKHLDRQPRDWDEAALRELLLHLVPRDMAADRELLGKIPPVTEAFLYWLGSERILDDADDLIAKVRAWSGEIIAAGMDRKNWSPVKTFVMGLDESDADAVNEKKVMGFVTRQLTESLEGLPEPPPEPDRYEPPIPIVEQAAKPARNAPCPCGSGKKYKKCHGRPDAEQPASK
ncbi:MAG: hypothetical protein A2Y77_12855 [Planctomycetes bacterium RBG_13_62_9]|nr:MAG: hypothetical protein A2Y77_12855 [Planctomycetes bacterium RBG_13_62_9]